MRSQMTSKFSILFVTKFEHEHLKLEEITQLSIGEIITGGNSIFYSLSSSWIDCGIELVMGSMLKLDSKTRREMGLGSACGTALVVSVHS